MIPFPSRRSFARVVSAGSLCALALGLGGCPDDPHFDAAYYEIGTSSLVLVDRGSGFTFSDPPNFLDRAAGYATSVCPGSTVTVGPGARTLDVDWHGCNSVFSDAVGTFEYQGGGIYAGLIETTVDVSGTPTTFVVELRLEPRTGTE